MKETIWKFEDVADKNFSNYHKSFEIHKIVKGKITKETYLFSQNNNKIEKLVIEILIDEVKEVEVYYFNDGKLVLAKEVVYSKFENQWTDS